MTPENDQLAKTIESTSAMHSCARTLSKLLMIGLLLGALPTSCATEPDLPDEELSSIDDPLQTCGSGLFCALNPIVGATLCQSGSQQVYCCPLGQTISNGVCVLPGGLPPCGSGLYCSLSSLIGANRCQSGSQSLYCCPFGQMFANGACVPVLAAPSGYQVEAQSPARNVITYRYTQNTAKTWYVTVAHMRSVRMRSLIGAIKSADNSIFTKTQAGFLTQAQNLGLGAPAAIINGTFFGYPSATDHTRAGIAFGLKVSNPSYLALGYDGSGNRYIMGWNESSRASIRDSTDGANQFDPTGFTNAIGGLSALDCKRCTEVAGRTFLGVRGDHLLIFSAHNATSAEARAELGRWSPSATMQLDGGGSSFLIGAGRNLVNTDGRLLPHAVAVFP